MRPVLRALARCWRWLLFAIFVLAEAWLLDALIPPAPPWTIVGTRDIQHWTPDGRTLLTIRWNGGAGNCDGPLELWDVADGRCLASFFTQDDLFSGYRHTSDAKHVFCLRQDVNDSTAIVCHVDTANECVTEYAIPGIATPSEWVISPQADLIAIADVVDQRRGKARLTIFDVATRSVLARLPLSDWSTCLVCTEQYLIFTVPAGKQESTVFWNTRSRKTETVLNKCALAGRHENPNRPDEPYQLMAKEPFEGNFQTHGVWDVHRQCWALNRVDSYTSNHSIFLSRNDRVLFDRVWAEGEDCVAEVWDLHTDKCIAAIPHVGGRLPDLSPDGKLLAVETCPPRSKVHGIIVFDVNSQAQLWEKYWPDNQDSLRPQFSSDSQTLFIYASPLLQIEVLHARTGAARNIIRLPSHAIGLNNSWHAQNPLRTRFHWRETADLQSFQSPGLAWLQQFLPNQGSSQATFASVIDSATGRERLRVLLPEIDAESWLSDDGARLLICTRNDRTGGLLRCWDVPSPHPWPWIIGVCLATATSLFALRWAWRRRMASREGQVVSRHG
jgi:hypothetical protein